MALLIQKTLSSHNVFSMIFFVMNCVRKFFSKQFLDKQHRRRSFPLVLVVLDVTSRSRKWPTDHYEPALRQLARIRDCSPDRDGQRVRNERAVDEPAFPVFIGVLVWLPPYLLNQRLRSVIPFAGKS